MRPYDSLKQDKREFVPRDGDHVTMYFCGHTVYNCIHLVNITDIDDRIITKAIAEAKDCREISDFYAVAYTEDTSR